MKCPEVENMIPDFLQGSLPQGSLLQFQVHAAHCPSCSRLLDDHQGLWSQLEGLSVGEPAPRLRENFYNMLASYQAGQAAAEANSREGLPQRLGGWLRRLWPTSPASQMVLLGAVFLLGLWLGYLPVSRQVDNLQGVQKDYQTLTHRASLSLMQHPSPSERLSGVRWSTRLPNADPRVRDALLYILAHDTNINVRLSAVEALFLHRDDPIARTGLVQALGKASSPMIQAALIDTLVAMGEKKATQGLEDLLRVDDLNPIVREKARDGLRYMQ